MHELPSPQPIQIAPRQQRSTCPSSYGYALRQLKIRAVLTGRTMRFVSRHQPPHKTLTNQRRLGAHRDAPQAVHPSQSARRVVLARQAVPAHQAVHPSQSARRVVLARQAVPAHQAVHPTQSARRVVLARQAVPAHQVVRPAARNGHWQDHASTALTAYVAQTRHKRTSSNTPALLSMPRWVAPTRASWHTARLVVGRLIP